MKARVKEEEEGEEKWKSKSGYVNLRMTERGGSA